MSRWGARAALGQKALEILLGAVAKLVFPIDDIEVRFYEDDENGWQAFGDFSPTDVHKQVP